MWIFHFVENVIYGLSNQKYCFDIIVDGVTTVVLQRVWSLTFLFANSHTEQKLKKKTPTNCSTEEHLLLTYIKYKPKIIITDIHIILTDMITDLYKILTDPITDIHKILTDTITDIHKILTNMITDINDYWQTRLLTCTKYWQTQLLTYPGYWPASH
jgi:ribosomal protein S18